MSRTIKLKRVYEAPAAVVLHTARAALDGRSGVVELAVKDGRCAVVDANNTEMVILA